LILQTGLDWRRRCGDGDTVRCFLCGDGEREGERRCLREGGVRERRGERELEYELEREEERDEE